MGYTIDRSKHKYAWWLNVDVEVHCVCGDYVQFVDPEQEKACEECGQPWKLKVDAVAIGTRYEHPEEGWVTK